MEADGKEWKINQSQKIFNDSIKNILNITDIHNYYGMIEQTGSIFLSVKKVIFILQFSQKYLLETKIYPIYLK